MIGEESNSLSLTVEKENVTGQYTSHSNGMYKGHKLNSHVRSMLQVSNGKEMRNVNVILMNFPNDAHYPISATSDEDCELLLEIFKIAQKKPIVVHCKLAIDRTANLILLLELFLHAEEIFPEKDAKTGAEKCLGHLARLRGHRLCLMSYSQNFEASIRGAARLYEYVLKKYNKPFKECLAVLLEDPEIVALKSRRQALTLRLTQVRGQQALLRSNLSTVKPTTPWWHYGLAAVVILLTIAAVAILLYSGAGLLSLPFLITSGVGGSSSVGATVYTAYSVRRDRRAQASFIQSQDDLGLLVAEEGCIQDEITRIDRTISEKNKNLPKVAKSKKNELEKKAEKSVEKIKEDTIAGGRDLLFTTPLPTNAGTVPRKSSTNIPQKR